MLHGDVVFDESLGSTILSGDVFVLELAKVLKYVVQVMCG